MSWFVSWLNISFVVNLHVLAYMYQLFCMNIYIYGLFIFGYAGIDSLASWLVNACMKSLQIGCYTLSSEERDKSNDHKEMSFMFALANFWVHD